MNRTLRRPMFRMGGSTEGITSGLDMPKTNASRQNFKNGNSAEYKSPLGLKFTEMDLSRFKNQNNNDMESRYKRAMDFIESKRTPRTNDLNDFLISMGCKLQHQLKVLLHKCKLQKHQEPRTKINYHKL